MAIGKFREFGPANIASVREARLIPPFCTMASPSEFVRLVESGRMSWTVGRADGSSGWLALCCDAVPRSFLFVLRSLASRSLAARSSACHRLVASGSLHPKIRASQRILSMLMPLSLSWNQTCTVRRSTPSRFASMEEMASARVSGVQGPSGIPRLSAGRPAPCAARRANSTLKLSKFFCGATKYLPFLINRLQPSLSFFCAAFRILSCIGRKRKHN